MAAIPGEIYPELVQYGPGLKEIVPSFAKSWDTSADGKTWTYHLQSGGKWSDGQPLTSADVAWTANTIIKYQSGATAVLASALSHVTKVDAPDPNTVVFHYDTPVGNALPNVVAKYAKAAPGRSADFMISGPVCFRRTVLVDQEGNGQVVVGLCGPPDVVLHMDLETYVRLTAGRCGPESVRVAVQGDHALASRILAGMAVTP